MFPLSEKNELFVRLHDSLIKTATADEGVNAMTAMQILAGMFIEVSMLFDEPDEAMETMLRKMADDMNTQPFSGFLAQKALPPAHIMDRQIERGRLSVRMFMEDWMGCEFQFFTLISELGKSILTAWEPQGLVREESFRLFIECARRGLAYEVAAQEFCDLMIERKVIKESWSLAECIVALSAVSGRRLALSLYADASHDFQGSELPKHLDNVVYVMTHEAVRLGVPAGTDWRFGLPANDTYAEPPIDLIVSLEPHCHDFFSTIKLTGVYDQAVACAKAAGRMLAVACGGDSPEIEPAIAKPLAMAAITETYRSMCHTYKTASL